MDAGPKIWEGGERTQTVETRVSSLSNLGEAGGDNPQVSDACQRSPDIYSEMREEVAQMKMEQVIYSHSSSCPPFTSRHLQERGSSAKSTWAKFS